MWDKYNRWLIECAKKAKTNDTDLELSSITVVSFLGLSFLVYFLPLIIHTTIVFGFMAIILYKAFKGASIKLRAIDAIGYYLHLISPYANKRRGEIEDYIHHLVKLQNENPLVSDLFLQRASFQIIEKESLNSWVRTFIGKEKSLIPLIQDRVLGCSHLRDSLLFWSQLLPKEILSFDDFKTLLLLNPIKTREQLWGLSNFPEGNLNAYFANYSSAELKRLFSSSFYLNDYLEVLNIAGRYNITLEIKKDMEELKFWSQMMEAAYQGSQFHFPEGRAHIKIIPETPCALGIVNHIDNIAKLDWWAKALNNCLVSYRRKALTQEGYLFGIYQDGKPWAAFYVTEELHLVEFKRKANGDVNLDQRNELERVLRLAKALQ